MARNKDKLVDKLGMVYIIFIIAVPSLAYILLFQKIGVALFGLPSVFTTYGASDVRSWILPSISLALPSISGLMLWMRRYVVDQMNSDYVKFAKAKGATEKTLIVDTSKDKTNLSGLKLTYTPKNGTFKGSFKVFTLQSGKLKKYTVNVNGVVIDGMGYGAATCKKPAVTWQMSVQ